MELTNSFLLLLQQFIPVFTAPTFQTFVEVVTGWLLSHRHRYVTDLIFSSGNVDNGHWSRFHRFFSHAAWDFDVLCLHLAKLVVTLLAPGATLLWAVDDTLCRKRGLTLYGVGMHHDPLISSRAKPLVSWGHDWVVLCLLLVQPFWAPTKVFALPIAVRLYRNRQGVTKGKKGKASSVKPKADPNHRTRPQLALELISLVATWFPHDDIVVTGDSAYGGRSVLAYLPAHVHLLSHVHPKGALYEPPPPPAAKKGRGAPRKKGARRPGMADWAADASKPWTELTFDQFGFHATVEVKTQQALYYKAGGSRLLTIVLVHDVLGQRPDQMFYCTKLDWDARQILSTYAHRWAIECTFENCKQFLGLEDPANRLPLAVSRTAPLALVLYALVILWFHRTGSGFVRFPKRPWYRRKEQPSFADLLATLRRVSYDDKTHTLHPKRTRLKTWITKLTELLSRPA
jgi:DDE superfamily endonuclease